jgi:arsenate reductase-like glutaredoxin family protein
MNLPEDFDLNVYKNLNSDLNELNNEELINHYLTNGINEDRPYTYNLPKDFDLDSYKKLNKDLKDLNDNEIINHYLNDLLFAKGPDKNEH